MVETEKKNGNAGTVKWMMLGRQWLVSDRAARKAPNPAGEDSEEAMTPELSFEDLYYVKGW